MTDRLVQRTDVQRTDAEGWQVEKQSDRIYRITRGGCCRGYVERVGTVWVTLAGSRLDHCVEIGQSLSFERAAALLRGYAAA